jgi:phage terminase Nu1 subunit (DNA packaging protein)
MTETLDLSQPCTHEKFASLVGISRQAVGAHVENGVLPQGGAIGGWILDYTAHLREHAAGRGNGMSELSFQRAELARVSRERAEIKLAVERGEFAPFALLAEALSFCCKTIVSHIEAIPPDLRKRFPELTPEMLKLIKEHLQKAMVAASSASLKPFEDVLLETNDEQPEIFGGADDE